MQNSPSHHPVFDITIKMLVMLLIIVWCLAILYPFVSIILWSLILALAMHPLHSRMTKWLGGRRKLASFIIVFVILGLVMLPTGLLIESLVQEVKELKVSYESGTLTIPPPTEKVKEWPLVGNKLYEVWNSASVSIEQTILKHKEQLLGVGTKVAKGIMSTAGSVIQIMISLIIAGILLCFGSTGTAVRKVFHKLAGSRGDEFAEMTVQTVANVVKGILGVALILAILHGILFMLAGVPLAGIWTLIVFVLAVLQIPLFIVTLPIIIFMFATKSIVAAILWTVGLLIIGFSDNILRPLLLGKGAPVPMLVIFIGVIGGFILSGFIGLFTGAIVFSIGYKLFIQWLDQDNELPARK
jgi:predicted PurR-regulated permease PerM